ncbi:MAG: ComF family protein, partial [Stackebrandtia sp.]
MSDHRLPVPAEAAHRLRDLIAVRDCAGCHGTASPGRPLCGGCRAVVAELRPVTADVPGVDAVAAGAYTGVLRECLLGFKERHRRDLAEPLARLLANALSADPASGPVWLVPIPATRRALRQRGFDHVGLLCRRLARLLPDTGTAAVLRARPRPDSTELNLA